ncbi:MAG: RDD family protein [Bacteroidia bacterium]|nr:RDD family protein [Bacteroidia bacterium]
MRAIEITTTQNVVIQVKLATLMDRIIGFVIDLIAMALLAFLFFAIVEAVTHEEWPFYVVILVLWFYSLLFELALRGQSPGKAIVGIKVIKVDGGQPEFIDYFRRWAIRWIDIYATFGAVAMSSVSTSDKGQRLGDKMADTMVVKKKQLSGYELKDILGITSASNYTPKYPEIKETPESHMLLVKRVLSRHQLFPGISSYADMIRELGDGFEARLGIKRSEASHQDFLRQLLKDYVILTR